MTLDHALAPLDAVRSGLYRRLAPTFGPWIRDRDTRVAAYLAMAVLGGLGATLAAPLTMLVWAPLVLGVPHLVSEVRYLVVRPGLHRRLPVILAVGGPLLAVLTDPRVGLLATLGAILVARARPLPRLVALAGWALLFALAWRRPTGADLLLLHLHNAVALGLWWAWRSDRSLRQWGAVALAAVVYVGFAVGAFDALVSPGGPFVHGVDINGIASGIAPGRTIAGLSSWHLLLAYIFGQSIHYAVWLRLVPEDDRVRYTPRPFRATARALLDDLGPALLLGGVGVWLTFLSWGTQDPAAARLGYLQAALFHAHLEIALGALAVLERRRPGHP